MTSLRRTTPLLIGLSGYARTGKDTVAAQLVTFYGYQRRAFADPLRATLLALDPYLTNGERYSSLMDRLGYEEAKDHPVHGPEVRRLLQRMGTEAGRGIHGDSVWVDAAMRNLDRPTVLTDVRFANEAAEIRRLGGVVWEIARPGCGPATGHASDVSIPGDRVLVNAGTLHELDWLIDKELRG